MMTGNPIRLATSTASSGSPTGPGEPGTTGILSSSASFRAAALSPMSRICSGLGPMNAMLELRQASANSADSARKP